MAKKTPEEQFITNSKDSVVVSIQREDGFCFDASKIKDLAKTLKQNSNLQSLTIRGALYFLNEQNCLAYNHVDRKKSCKSLAKLITAHPNLETFDIGDNSVLFYSDIVEIIGALAKHEKIKTVKFDGNNIFLTDTFDQRSRRYLEQRQSSDAIDLIINMLNKNKSIEVLDLSGCELNEEDFVKLNACVAKIKWRNPERKLHIIIGDEKAIDYQHLFAREVYILDKGKGGPWSCNVVVLKDGAAFPQPATVDKSAIYIQGDNTCFYNNKNIKCGRSIKFELVLNSIVRELKLVRHANTDGSYALQPRDQELLVASLQHIEKLMGHIRTNGKEFSYKKYLDETEKDNLQGAVDKYFENSNSDSVLEIVCKYGVLPQFDDLEQLEAYYMLPDGKVFFERMEEEKNVEIWLIGKVKQFGASEERLNSVIDILFYRMGRKKDCGVLLSYFLALYDAISNQGNKNKLFDILLDKFLNYSVDSKNDELLKGVIDNVGKHLDGVRQELSTNIEGANKSQQFFVAQLKSPALGYIAGMYGKFIGFCEKQKGNKEVQELARTMAVQLLKYYSTSCLNNDVVFNYLARLLKIIDKKDLPEVFSSVYLIDRAKFITGLSEQYGKGLGELAPIIILCLISAQNKLEKEKACDSIITFCSSADIKEVFVWLEKLTTEKMANEVFGMVKVRLLDEKIQFDKNDFVAKLDKINNRDLILNCLNTAFPDQNVLKV